MRSRFIQGVAAALIVAVLPAQSFATEPFAKVGTYALQFLKIGVSARGSAMGGAFTAISNDATATYWNPAGMSRLPGRQGVLGLNAIYGSARFTDQGTTSPAGPAFPITGGEQPEAGVGVARHERVEEPAHRGLGCGSRRGQRRDLAVASERELTGLRRIDAIEGP